MAQEILLYASNEEAATAAIARAGGRLTHVLTPRVFVADMPDGVDARQLPGVSTNAPADLDELGRMVGDAWHRRAAARLALSAVRPLKWDTPGFQPPGLHHTPQGAQHLALGRGIVEATGTPTSLYLTGKVAVGIVSVSGSPWTQRPGALTWVSVGQDGTVWGVNRAGNIYRWTGSDWQQMPGALSQISVANASTVWGVNSSGKIYRWTGSNWQQLPGALTCVSAAADGTVWGVNSAGNIYRWTGTNWQQMPGALSNISVANATTVWGVNSAGNIYRWTGSNWTLIPGGLTNVSAAPDGSVFGVNSAGNIFRYLSSGNTWQQIPGGLSQISAASASNVWGVNSSGNIYSGNASSGLNFSASDINTIVSEVQEGLSFLASAEPLAKVTFYYDWKTVNVSATPGPDPSIPDPYEAYEAPWRNAALVAMGYQGSEAGSRAYVDAIKAAYNTNWAYVGYFTKYPLQHFAYQTAERTVMQYANDGWGPQRINQVFAHETCHVFGAADEYGSCGCGVSGYFAIRNGNCVNCTPSQIDCLMNANTLSLCAFSREQIGWSSWMQMPGALTWVSVGQDDTVWGVNSAGNIYRWTGSNWQQMPGGLSQISVANASTVWGVNSSGNIYRWTGSNWQQLPGALTCVSAAADGTVWGVNSGHKIYRWTGTNWQQMPGALSNISAGNASTVWGVNSSGNIYRWNGTDWTQVPGGLSNISAASDGTVWGVNSAGKIYRWMGTDWQQIPGALVEISAGNAKNIWGVNAGSNIYQRRILATP